MTQESDGRAGRDAGELARRLGDGQVIAGEAASRYAVDGREPWLVCTPETVAGVSEAVAWANAGRRALVPWGGGTQIDLGGPPEHLDLVLSLERLDRLVAYEPADMTVTVEAGMPLARLQEILAGEGQFLPVDPPLPRRATIGGILATRSSGPLRAAHRTITDRLLGVRVVNADGRVTKAGGRVVKNVAGYEMGRLYAGSHGTLAVIVEATFKVQPLPEAHEALLFELESPGRAEALLAGLLQSEATPAFVELVGPLEEPAEGALLAAGFSGTEAEVKWALAGAQQRAAGSPGVRVVGARPWSGVYPTLIQAHRSDAYPSLLHGLSGSAGTAASLRGETEGERSAGPAAGSEFVDGAAVCRVHVLPARLAAYLEGALDAARRAGIPLRYASHASSGVARLHLGAQGGAPGEEGPPGSGGDAQPGGSCDPGALAALARALRAQAEAAGGFLVIESAPLAVKERVPVFGEPRGDFFLHRSVKEKLDPHRIFSPGRFLGGL